MNLPKAVLEQEAEANRLFDGQEKIVEAEVEIEVDPELLKKEEEVVPLVDIDNLGAEPSEPAKIIKKAPEKDVEAEKLSTTEAMNKKLTNANRTLEIKQGQHDRVVSDLRKEVDELKTLLIKKEDPEPKTEPTPSTSKFSDDERQALIDDGLSEEVVAVLEKRGIQPAAVVDNSRLDKIESDITSAKDRELEEKMAKFWGDLDKAAPQWDGLNEDPGFTEFLRNIPPYSDRTLGQIMQDAQGRLDVTTIAKIFNDYTAGTISLDLDKNEDPSKDKKLDKEKPKLEDLAAPKSTGAKSPEAKPGKWTTEQTTKFYNYVAKNPGKYTDEEIRKIEMAHVYPN